MQITLYKLNLLVQDYPILKYIIKNVVLIHQGNGEKSTIVQVYFNN